MHKDLFGTKIQEALDGLAVDWSALRCLDALRKRFAPDLAREAAALYELRKRCKPRIGMDLLPFLCEPNASQVTAPGIARYRAQEIARRPQNSHIWDATCGLGMESVHLASAGLHPVASDRNPEIAAYAAANLAFHGFPAQVVCADATDLAVRADGVLLDPDRRPGGKRTLDPKKWSPTLQASLGSARRHGAAAIKLPPAFPCPPEWLVEHRVEWISLDGELLECCLWIGSWAEGTGARAVRLGPQGVVHTFCGEATEVEALLPGLAESIPYLADPDPSLIRSGLLGSFALEHGMAPLAPHLGYLGSEGIVDSPLVRQFRVLDSCPLDRGQVRAMLGRHDVGPIQVRLRGHQERPEDLAKRLRGPGSQIGHIAIARLDAHRWVYLLDSVADSARQKGN